MITFFELSGKYFLILLLLLLSITAAFSQCTLTWYQDNDADGFGIPGVSTVTNCGDPPPAGYTLNRLDCNDNSPNNKIWATLGATGFSSGAVTATKIAVAQDGTPFVLYRNYTVGLESPMTVKKYTGSMWTTLGSDPLSADYLYGANIVVDGSGVPYVSYLDFDPLDVTNNSNRATVIKHDGSTWVQVGSRRFSDVIPAPAAVSIAIDDNDVPYVAFVNSSMQVIVMKYDTGLGDWVMVGAGPVSSSSLFEVSIAIDNLGTPYVAFGQDTDGKITVMKYNGAAWTLVGSASFSDNDIDFPSIKIDYNGIPYVLYYDYGTSEIVVQQFTSGSWQKVGPAVFTGVSSYMSFDIGRDNVPYVGYRDGITQNITVRAWTGAAWQVVGTSEFTTGLALSLALGPKDNIPYVSFADTGDGDKAKVKSISPQPSLPDVPTLGTTKSAICEGESATLSIVSGNLRDAANWTWYSASCGGTLVGTGTSITVSPTTTTTYFARGEGSCVPSPAGCANLTITVNTLPVISSQPPASTEVCENSTATISLSTSGSDLAYQWYVDRNDGSGWVTVSGETSASITLANVPNSSNNYQYRNIVTNTTTTCQSTSSPSQLVVNALPVINTQPASTPILCENGTLELSIITAGGLDYQWYHDPGSGWSMLSGEVNSTLSVSGITSSMNNYQYRVSVTNPSTTCTTTSSAATLSVVEPPLVTIPPSDVEICEGNNALFTVSGINTASYQWQVNAAGSWEDITGATTGTLNVNNIALNMTGYRYRAMARTPFCPDDISTEADLVVHPNPSIISQPLPAVACEGDDVEFTVDANTGVTYQWQVDTGSGWSDMAGEQGVTLSLQNISTATTANHYRVEVQSTNCGSVMSDEVFVSIDPAECADELIISEGVSPNGDDVQDYWILHGIQQYPNNRIKIFNIWGDLIFETKGYDNITSTWRGQSNQGFAGSIVPDGTYYYIIDLGTGNSRTLKGFVVLKR